MAKKKAGESRIEDSSVMSSFSKRGGCDEGVCYATPR